MKDIPMMLSGKMVRAFLEGRKTQTRRLTNRFNAQPGDRIWFKETFRIPSYSETNTPIYRASENDDYNKTEKWKPSIFMPKRFCRCWAEIVEVRVEWLRDITSDEALSEGVLNRCAERLFVVNATPKQAFADLWDSLNKKPGTRWEDNPVVFTVTFKKIKP